MQEHLIHRTIRNKNKYIELWDFQLVDGGYHVWLQTRSSGDKGALNARLKRKIGKPKF